MSIPAVLLALSLHPAMALPPAGENSPTYKSMPITMSARVSNAVPAAGHGSVTSAGVGVGVMPSDRNALGLRVIAINNPPDNPFAVDTPEVPWAWGPVLDWQHYFQPHDRASVYTSFSLGYVYGTPHDEEANNVILPILEGGIGLRFAWATANNGAFAVSPELGVVPGALAPYAALNFSFIVPDRGGS